MKYEIINKASGVSLGVYSGVSPVGALAAMYRDAGYPKARVRKGCVTGLPFDVDTSLSLHER